MGIGVSTGTSVLRAEPKSGDPLRDSRWSRRNGLAAAAQNSSSARTTRPRRHLQGEVHARRPLPDRRRFALPSGTATTPNRSGRVFSDILAPSRAVRKRVIIDACQSYYVAFGRGSGARRTPYEGRFLPRTIPAEREDTGFLLSTSSDRDSREWARFQAGVFSYELRSGLRGAADADVDGQITYAELAAYLDSVNAEVENPRHRPDHTVRAPGRDTELAAPILDWQRPPDLHVDRDAGHLYLESALGVRILDVHTADRQPVHLFLPRQRPLFLHSFDERRDPKDLFEQPSRTRIRTSHPICSSAISTPKF